jgi:hypothetical protein
VASEATKIRSADVFHRRLFFGGDLKVGVGYEQWDAATPGQDSEAVRGFVQWARQIQ